MTPQKKSDEVNTTFEKVKMTTKKEREGERRGVDG